VEPPFYLNLGKRVNTIIGGFQTTDFSHYADRPEIPNQVLMLELLVCAVLRALRDKPLRAADARIQGVTRCPQRADKINTGCGWLIATVLAEVLDAVLPRVQVSL
jgi:hypothetical protein